MRKDAPLILPGSMKKALLAVLFLYGVMAPTIEAQSSNQSNYLVRRISILDNMYTQTITALCMDGNGVLWAGTLNGLYRFDGFRMNLFESFLSTTKNHPRQHITGLEVDTSGGNMVFVSTERGISVIDVTTGNFIADTALGLPTGFLDTFIQIKKCREGDYWLLSRDKMFKLIKKSDSKFTYKYYYDIPKCYMPKIVADPTDTDGVWVLPTDSVLYHFSSMGAQTYNIIPFKANLSPINGATNLSYTKNGIVYWDIARNFYSLDLNAGSTKIIDPKSIDIYDIYPFLEGVDSYVLNKPHVNCQMPIWGGQQIFGTNAGMFIVRKKQKVFQSIKELEGKEIRGILTEATGKWWAGTYNGLFTGHLHKEGVRQLNEFNVWDFLHIEGDVYLTARETTHGLAYFDVNLQKRLVHKAAPTLSSGKDMSTALALCRDLEGNLWVGTDSQLLCAPALDPGRLHLVYDTRKGTPTDFRNVRALLADTKSGIWAGSDNGLVKVDYNAHKNTFLFDLSIPRLDGVFISDLFRDQNERLWIATKGKGVVGLNLKDYDEPIRWYNSSIGLSNDFACRIEASENDQVLWISTHNGLSRYDTRTGVFHNFYDDSGIPANEFNSAASARFADGTLIFGGVSGLVAFNPDSVHVSDFTYKTILSTVRVYDQKSSLLQSIYLSPSKGISLPPNPEYLEFQLGSTEYLNPDKIRFRYRMHGLSAIWSYTNGEREIKFIRIAPGDYVLEVQAIPLDGHFGKSVLLPVHIMTPYYETWWFRFLLVSALLCMTYLVYNYRVRQILNDYQMRRQIADDLHDDIGNKLNVIYIIAQKIAKSSPGNDLKTAELKELVDMCRNALRSLNTMIWSVDTVKNKFQHLSDRMQDYADNYLRPMGIKFHFEIQKSIPDRNINLKMRHHILLIYQELLTNMVKYTQPHLIIINVEVERETLRIKIVNHFDKSAAPNYQVFSANRGLGSIERRLNRINASCLWSEPSSTPQEILLEIPKIF